MSIGTKLCFVLLQRYQSDSTIGSKILLESFPDFIFDFFPCFFRNLYYKQNSFHTNAPGWCLMKCINYHRLATCSFHLPDFLTRFLARFLSRDSRFLTVQDNSISYQGFQEVTGICGKIQDLGKSFKIFYTGKVSKCFNAAC